MPTLIMSLADSDTDIAFTALEVRFLYLKTRTSMSHRWSRYACRVLLWPNGSFEV